MKITTTLFQKIIVTFIFSILSLTFFGCNEQPTNISSPLINDTIILYPISSATTKIITESESFKYRINGTFNRGVLFVGKGNEATAISLIRFSFPDTTYDYLDAADILESNLILQPNRYSFGDSTGQQSFTIHELKKGFVYKTNWDSIYTSGGTSDYFSDEIYGSFDGTIELKDTMPEIKIPFSKELVVRWLKDTSKTEFSDAIGILPTENSQMITRFSAQEVGVNERDQIYQKIEIIFTNNESNLDTVVFKSSNEAYYVDGPGLEDKTSLMIQGGIVFRSQLLFDINGVLPEMASIHTAQLELTLDTLRSVSGNFGLDSVLIGGYYEKLYNINPKDKYIYMALKKTNSSVYIFPSISSALESWNRGDGKGNIGIVSSRQGLSSMEFKLLDKYVFYGLNAQDSTKRPILKIIYSDRINK